MSFSTYEESVDASQPVEVIRFVLGGLEFNFTSGEDDITVDGVDYSATAIRRGKIVQTSEERADTLQITVPNDNTFASLYVDIVPSAVAVVEVRRVQRLDGALESVLLFSGEVSSVKFTQDATIATITCEPLESGGRRLIPRYTFRAMCNHILYDERCKVDSTDPSFRHSGTVTSITGNSIEVSGASGFADGFFDGGYVEVSSGNDVRLIISHVGNTLQMLLPFAEDRLNAAVVVLAGCDHTPNDCNGKFFTSEDLTSNLINYGGFPFVPTRNIFISGLV